MFITGALQIKSNDSTTGTFTVLNCAYRHYSTEDEQGFADEAQDDMSLKL